MSRRFDQCDETCTTDCGHCKGQLVQAMRDELEALRRDRQWEHDRANEAARLSAEARDQAEELRREVERLGEHISAVEEDRAAAQRDAQSWKSARDATLREAEIVAGQKKRLQDDLEHARAELAAAKAEVDELHWVFNKQWERAMAATELWRAEDPATRGRSLPDLGELFAWLIERGNAQQGVGVGD